MANSRTVYYTQNYHVEKMINKNMKLCWMLIFSCVLHQRKYCGDITKDSATVKNYKDRSLLPL